MKKSLLAFFATLAFGLTAHASVLSTRTVANAELAGTYDTFHDGASGFVFVKLPQGWTFVAQDNESASHAVFYDVSTGFVFVKLSSGWKFVQRV